MKTAVELVVIAIILAALFVIASEHWESRYKPVNKGLSESVPFCINPYRGMIFIPCSELDRYEYAMVIDAKPRL